MKISFSTDLIDLNNQSPNRNKRESKYYWDELYTLIQAAGFDSIDFPYQPKWDFGGRSGIPLTLRSITTKFESVSNYVDYLKAVGINSISNIHFDPTLFCNGNIDMYFGAFNHYISELLSFAKEAETKTISISVTPTYNAVSTLKKPDQSMENLHHEFLERTKETITAVAKEANSLGIKICLRNEYWGLLKGDAITEFFSTMTENVYLDVDTAHLYVAGIDVHEFINKHLDSIGVIHFTDTSFIDNVNTYMQALPEFPANNATKVFKDIGTGSIDFNKIYKLLAKEGYENTIVFSCRNSYDASRSLLRTRYHIDRSIIQA
ncbi:MAG: sugar phosphate isomerase/epimerase family protein [Suipraeoptans sp.]